MFDPIINNDNDDDIFDDSKTLFNSNENISDNSDTRKQNIKSLDGIIDDIFNNRDIDSSKVDELINNFGSEIFKAIGNLRFELASTFYESASKWFSDYKSDKTSFAAYSYLTDISNGRYPLYQKFYELEIDIVKRHVVCSFLSKTFLETSSNSLEKVSKLFNVPVDTRFMKTYFESVFDIILFTNIQDIGFYKALGQELSLPIKDSVLDGSIRLDRLVGSHRRNDLLIDSLTDELRTSIASHVKEEMSNHELEYKESK